MDESRKDVIETGSDGHGNLRAVVRDVIHEFVQFEQTRAEPAYKTELVEERKRREQLEARLNQLVEENRRAKQTAEELERAAAIRGELQRLGVAKLDLAFKAVKDEIVRAPDGRLVARTPQGDLGAKEYLAHFVNENPELLPARISGGSGAVLPRGSSALAEPPIDLDQIRPGMSQEELERVRQEIARIASQAMRGQ